MSEPFYYIVDLRPEWAKRPFVSFWRPKNCGYAYPLSWSGKYARDELEPGYHYALAYGSKRTLLRFPVLCATVEAIAIPLPDDMKHMIDGGAGPVVLNTGASRKALRRARLRISSDLNETVAA